MDTILRDIILVPLLCEIEPVMQTDYQYENRYGIVYPHQIGRWNLGTQREEVALYKYPFSEISMPAVVPMEGIRWRSSG
jgi:hypothetical protein